jgi:hypothetical protein
VHPGTSGVRDTRGAAAARGRLQPAGQLQDLGGRPAPPTGRAVSPHPRHRRHGLGRRDAGGQRGLQEKELVGRYKNNGKDYRPTGDPEKVEIHDFIGEAGKAIPYGVFDLGTNTGWVSVGTDHETVAFAVNTLRTWWNTRGRHTHPDADQLLITADSGGSNGNRRRTWKTELAALAAETGLAISVCHLPPGTSKWNKIEHRLFSQITMNWRGRPLTSHETILKLIGATTTATGLTVTATLDTGSYPIGIKISDHEMAALPITRDEFHGDWNYTLHPTNDTPKPN